MLHSIAPNSEISLLENASIDQLLDFFESYQNSKLFSRDYSRLSSAWGILFSHLYLSHIELEDEIRDPEHRLGEDKERMLRELITTDCELGGVFVMNLIKSGTMMDRSALLMIANLEDLARVEQEGTTALHLLARTCDKGIRPALITKAGNRLLSKVYDRRSLPVLLSLFGLPNLCEKDLDAMASVFSKEQLRNVTVENGGGRNALEIYTEISTSLRTHKSQDLKKIIKDSAPKAAQRGGGATGQINSPALQVRNDSTVAKEVPLQKAEVRSESKPDLSGPEKPLNPGIHCPVDKKMKVMIVDDDEIIRNLLQMRLKILGYENYIMAESGDDAMKLARETKPDLVFMDISMPGKYDGIAAAREIKSHTKARIIFLTGLDQQEIFDRAKEIRPSAYIVKPFSDTDLRIALSFMK
jgi:CheY-like chemotaxis protein